MKYGKAINFYNDGLQLVAVEKRVKITDAKFAQIETSLDVSVYDRFKEMNKNGFVPCVGGVSKTLQNIINGFKMPLVNQLLLMVYPEILEGTIDGDYTDISDIFIVPEEQIAMRIALSFNVKNQCYQSVFNPLFYRNDEVMKSMNLYTLVQEIEKSECVYYAVVGNEKLEVGDVYGSLIPDMLSNSQDSIVLTASSEYATEYIYKSFNLSLPGGWVSNTIASWFRVEFPVAKKITKIYTAPINSMVIGTAKLYFPITWKFYGSNDGTNWTELHSVTNEALRTDFLMKEYTLTQNGEYKHYKMDITTTGNGSITQMGKIKFYGIL